MSAITQVASADGTAIGYRRSGTGMPLVMVHGSPGDHSSFAQLAPLLEQAVSPCVIDRRGRGMSGDAPAYAHEREFEDVAAVVDSLGAADVFGHSYGGPVALEAARLSGKVRRLVLYEPWVGRYPEGLTDTIAKMADAGDAEGVLMAIFKDVAQMSDADIAELRARPSWRNRLELALVTAREAKAEDAYEFTPARFAQVTVPTLLLLGENSPPAMRETTEAIDAALPDSRIEILPGQEHLAHLLAPELLAEKILSFLT